MAHFISQFGPALKWPWCKLVDVPELTDELVGKIARQSDEQSGHYSVRELERIRDDNLVALMRALKGRNWGAGSHLNECDRLLAMPVGAAERGALRTVDRTVPVDWVDYNRHMNEGRYGQVFSDAADSVLDRIGADAAYTKNGNSFFTVETHAQYLHETCAGMRVWVDTFVRQATGKKLILHHEMYGDGISGLLASCDQTLVHVSLETRRACEPDAEVSRNMEVLAVQHAASNSGQG